MQSNSNAIHKPGVDWWGDRMEEQQIPHSLGNCFGGACMAMQAFLIPYRDSKTDELIAIDTFNKRIQRCFQLSKQNINLQTHTDALQKKRVESVKTKKLLTEEELEDLEIPTFFWNVSFYHSVFRFKHLFKPKMNLDIRAVNEVTSPDPKNKMALITRFSGVYTRKELDTILKTLEEQLINTTQPVAFFLVDYISYEMGHAIVLGYDPKKKQWYYFDNNEVTKAARQNVEKYNAIRKIQIAEIYDSIATSFKQVDKISFSSKVFTNENAVEMISPCIKKWKNLPEWTNAHTVTNEKLNLELNESHVPKWFLTAFENGEIQVSTEIMKVKLKSSRYHDIRTGLIRGIATCLLGGVGNLLSLLLVANDMVKILASREALRSSREASRIEFNRFVSLKKYYDEWENAANQQILAVNQTVSGLSLFSSNKRENTQSPTDAHASKSQVP